MLSYSRLISDKTSSIVRNLKYSNRVSLFSAQQRLQHAQPESKDAPIEIENPFTKEKKECLLCKHNIEPDYKNVRLLSQFQSRFTGRIYGRHITGLCKAKQEKVEAEIMKAQTVGLMGYYTKEVKYANDPKLFDIDNPFKSHKY